MQPYKAGFQVGHFGTDNPATDVAEQIRSPSTRKDVAPTPTGPSDDFVNIGIAAAEHGTTSRHHLRQRPLRRQR